MSVFSWLTSSFPAHSGTRAQSRWQSRAQPRCAASASRLSRSWRQSTRGTRTAAMSTISRPHPCASTWSTSSPSWRVYQRPTWRTASWRTSPSCRWESVKVLGSLTGDDYSLPSVFTVDTGYELTTYKVNLALKSWYKIKPEYVRQEKILVGYEENLKVIFLWSKLKLYIRFLL